MLSALKEVVADYNQGGKVCRVHCIQLQWGFRSRKTDCRMYKYVSKILHNRCERLQSLFQQEEVRCQIHNPIIEAEKGVVVEYNQGSKVCRVSCKSCNRPLPAG